MIRLMPRTTNEPPLTFLFVHLTHNYSYIQPFCHPFYELLDIVRMIERRLDDNIGSVLHCVISQVNEESYGMKSDPSTILKTRTVQIPIQTFLDRILMQTEYVHPS